MTFHTFKTVLLLVHSVLCGGLVLVAMSMHGVWAGVGVFVVLAVCGVANYLVGVMKGEGKI